MSNLMQQISVMRNNEDNQPVAFVTWVEVDKRLKVGSRVSFKDPGLKQFVWTITHIYEPMVEMDSIDYRKWDNNNYDKHQGLGL